MNLLWPVTSCRTTNLPTNDGGRAIFGSLWVCKLFKAFFFRWGIISWTCSGKLALLREFNSLFQALLWYIHDSKFHSTKKNDATYFHQKKYNFMGCPIFLNDFLFPLKPQPGELHGQESKKTTWADTLDSPGPAHYEEQQMAWGLMVCKNGLP